MQSPSALRGQTIRFAIAVLMVFECRPVPDLSAQSPAPLNPRIAVFVGGSFLARDRSFVWEAERFRSTFGKSLTMGVGGALDLAGEWSTEARYGFSGNSFRLTEGEGGASAVLQFDTHIHRLDAGVVRYFTTDGGLRPFVTVGIAVVHFDPEDVRRAPSGGFPDEIASRVRGTTEPGFMFGGGLEARFSRLLGIRVGIRDNVAAMPTFGLEESFPVGGVVHDFETTIGGVFHLP